MPDGQLWLMVACAVHVPLALAAVLPRVMSEEEERVWTVLCRLWFPAAVGLLISFLLKPGTWAVVAAVPWFLFAGLVGAFGVDFTWRHRRGGPWHEVLLGFAAAYFAGSAIWLLAQRGGWALLGFEEPWVTWTAAHFLVLGTSTLVVAAVMGRVFPQSARHRVMAFLLAAGLPCTALGIQYQFAWLERIGAWISLLAVRQVARKRLRMGKKPIRFLESRDVSRLMPFERNSWNVSMFSGVTCGICKRLRSRAIRCRPCSISECS